MLCALTRPWRVEIVTSAAIDYFAASGFEVHADPRSTRRTL
jgi:hypothetical protein